MNSPRKVVLTPKDARTAIRRHPVKFALAMLLVVLQFPFQVLFYFVQSAWVDAWRVGQWLRPALICEHGVDRNRAACDDCNVREEHDLMQSFSGAGTHRHFRCDGCAEVFCVAGEYLQMQAGDACPKCHIATVSAVPDFE